MKKIILFAASAFVMLSAACSKDTTEDPSTSLSGGQQVTLIASAEQQEDPSAMAGLDTRTSLANNKVVWTKADQIRIVSKTTPSTNAVYTLTKGENTTDGEFTGTEIKGDKYAFYPSANYVSATGTTLSFTLPATQTHVTGGTFANGVNPMVAKYDTNHKLQFKNLCGVIKLQLTGAVTVTKIEMTSPAGKIAGAATVDASAAVPAPVFTDAAATTITLTVPNVALNATTPTAFYFVVPYGNYDAGTTFTITASDGYSMKMVTKKPITVNRAKVLPLAKLAYSRTLAFPDATFRSKLTALPYSLTLTADGKDIDVNNAGNKAKFASTLSINVSNTVGTHGPIQSLTGIEYFTELTTLSCYWHQLAELDLSKNTKLISLDCGSNYLTSLKLPSSNTITLLKVADNKLATLDLSKYTELITLHCYQNALKTLDISGLPKLNITLLAAGSQNNNQTLTLKMTDAQKTTWATLSISSSNANVAGGYFPDANFRTYLATQGLVMTNDGTDIDVNNTTNRTKFKEIETITTNGDTGITSFKGVEFFTELTKFSYYKTSGKPTISSIDLTKNTKLTYIGCSSDISQIDLSKNPLLQELYLNDCSNLTSLNLSNCKAITTFQCRRSQLKTLDLSMLTVTDVSNFLVGSQRNAAGNALMVIAVRLSPAQAVKGISNSSFVDNIAICTAATGAKFIPDDAFRSYMVNTLKLVEKNGDIDFENDANQTIFRNTTEINCGSSAVNSVKGIECFYNLTWLGIPSCNLTSVDVSKNTELTTLWCSANKLTALNLSKNTKLSRLLCDRNQITALDLSKNTALLQVSAYQNCMSTLDLSMMKNVMTKNGSTTGIAVGGQVASVLGTPIQITLYVTQNQHTEGINTANNTNVTLQVK